MTARHRVSGLVVDGLRAARMAVPDTLDRRARRRGFANQRMAGETLRIGHAFARAGIDALFVKGLTLAAIV